MCLRILGSVLVPAALLLSMVGCARDAPGPQDVERGAFVMHVSGAVEDTVRGAAYLRDASTGEPGLELDADSVGWSVHWMQRDTVASYAIRPHTLLQAAQSAGTDGTYYPEGLRNSAPLASLFMAYGGKRSFEAQAGTLSVERATATDHVGHMKATLTLRGRAAPAEVHISGEWHAVPAPEVLPAHLREQKQ